MKAEIMQRLGSAGRMSTAELAYQLARRHRLVPTEGELDAELKALSQRGHVKLHKVTVTHATLTAKGKAEVGR